ncbi:MAG: histidinol-phosphate transaminase [Pseudomonadota bacterium]
MTAPIPRPGIMSIEPYVPGRSTLPGQAKTIKLSSNEGALGPSPRALAAYTAAAAEIHRYPDGSCADLRAAIGKRFGLDPERIVCGAGSDELIALLARAYAGPGDEVLYSAYGFLMYPTAAHGAGATPVAVPEREYTADVDALLAKAGPRTKICFLANPNNPTGTFLSAADVKLLRSGLPQSVLLVVDAAYAEYVIRNDYSPGIELVDGNDNVVMLRTFSKIFGLAALRLGWAYCPPPVAEVLNRLRGPFNVSAPAQAAGIAALADLAFLDACRSHNDIWRPWLARELAALGLEVIPSVANFVLVEFPATGTKTAVDARLNAAGIIARSVDGYGLPRHLRITIGTEAEMRAAVAAFADILA